VKGGGIVSRAEGQLALGVTSWRLPFYGQKYVNGELKACLVPLMSHASFYTLMDVPLMVWKEMESWCYTKDVSLRCDTEYTWSSTYDRLPLTDRS
jgi:hypothetical protein